MIYVKGLTFLVNSNFPDRPQPNVIQILLKTNRRRLKTTPFNRNKIYIPHSLKINTLSLLKIFKKYLKKTCKKHAQDHA